MKNFYKRAVSLIVVSCMMLAVSAAAVPASYAASPGGVRYIAHRGLSAKAPENTIAAFTLAAKRSGFYGVEFDIWESNAEKSAVVTKTVTDETGIEQTVTLPADPLLLVMHDSTTRRMCGVNVKMRSISRAELSRFTIKSGKNVSKYSGQGIPTCDEALDAIYRNSAGAIPVIELKHRLSKKALSYLLESLQGRRAVIISFDFKAVSDAVKMAESMGIGENIETMYLLSKLPKKKYASTIRKMKAAGIGCVSVKYTAVNKRMVKKFHRAGLLVGAWTLPNKKTARRYVRMGVDYITGNKALY